MNDISELASILGGLLAVVAFLLIFYGPVQWLCVSYARDVLFEQREAVFDMAARGILQFGSEPYEATRDEMNGMIRLAHRLTIWRLGLHRAFGLPAHGMSDIELALAELPDSVRDEVTARLRQARAAMALCMLVRSLPVVIVLIPALLLWRISRVGDKTIRAAEGLFAPRIHEAVQAEHESRARGMAPA